MADAGAAWPDAEAAGVVWLFATGAVVAPSDAAAATCGAGWTRMLPVCSQDPVMPRCVLRAAWRGCCSDATAAEVSPAPPDERVPVASWPDISQAEGPAWSLAPRIRPAESKAARWRVSAMRVTTGDASGSEAKAGIDPRDVLAQNRKRIGPRGGRPRSNAGQTGTNGRVRVPARHDQTPPSRRRRRAQIVHWIATTGPPDIWRPIGQRLGVFGLRVPSLEQLFLMVHRHLVAQRLLLQHVGTSRMTIHQRVIIVRRNAPQAMNS